MADPSGNLSIARRAVRTANHCPEACQGWMGPLWTAHHQLASSPIRVQKRLVVYSGVFVFYHPGPSTETGRGIYKRGPRSAVTIAITVYVLYSRCSCRVRGVWRWSWWSVAQSRSIA